MAAGLIARRSWIRLVVPQPQLPGDLPGGTLQVGPEAVPPPFPLVPATKLAKIRRVSWLPQQVQVGLWEPSCSDMLSFTSKVSAHSSQW